jgi:hypothetical protein
MNISKLLMAISLVFFLIATLSAAGVAAGIGWALPAGLAAMAAAFLV